MPFTAFEGRAVAVRSFPCLQLAARCSWSEQPVQHAGVPAPLPSGCSG